MAAVQCSSPVLPLRDLVQEPGSFAVSRDLRATFLKKNRAAATRRQFTLVARASHTNGGLPLAQSSQRWSNSVMLFLGPVNQSLSVQHRRFVSWSARALAGGGDGASPPGGNGTGGGGGGGGNEGSEPSSGDGSDSEKNRIESLAALAALGKSIEWLPADLAEAVLSGRVPAIIVERYAALQGTPLFRFLLKFGGFKERLLADDLFLTKVGIECGVGIFTKVSGTSTKGIRNEDHIIRNVIRNVQ